MQRGCRKTGRMDLNAAAETSASRTGFWYTTTFSPLLLCATPGRAIVKSSFQFDEHKQTNENNPMARIGSACLTRLFPSELFPAQTSHVRE
jgi:hypothetical protein